MLTANSIYSLQQLHDYAASRGYEEEAQRLAHWLERKAEQSWVRKPVGRPPSAPPR